MSSLSVSVLRKGKCLLLTGKNRHTACGTMPCLGVWAVFATFSHLSANMLPCRATVSRQVITITTRHAHAGCQPRLSAVVV